ncbi:MAG: DUF4249 domain-containing protein [Bacteroidales bacterium]|nr:DUF4249 domain-containing protein [Bacteroidales bacterium]
MKFPIYSQLFKLIQINIATVILSGMALFTLGCQKDDDFLIIDDIPSSDLCLTGFITPDSIYLVLGRSVPYNYPQDGSNPYLLPDTGIIWVEENGSLFDTLQPKIKYKKNYEGEVIERKVYYTSTRKPVEGRKYHIHAQYPGFRKVESTVYLPYRVPILRIDTMSIFKTNKIPINPEFPFIGTKDTLIRYLSGIVWFQDSLNSDNFYLFPLGNTVIHQPVIQFKNVSTFDDSRINGHMVPLYFEVIYEKQTIIDIELFAIDKEYFRYLIIEDHSLEAHKNKTFRNSYYEPIVSYSNTSNHLGMVAGYSKSLVKMQLTD